MSHFGKVDKVRDLGFVMASDPRSSERHRLLVKNASLRIYSPVSVLKSGHPEIYIRGFKTHVRPIMETGTTMINPAWQRDIDLLEGNQNSLTKKLMMGSFSVDYESVPNDSQWSALLAPPSLKKNHRRKTADVTMMYKVRVMKLAIKAGGFL